VAGLEAISQRQTDTICRYAVWKTGFRDILCPMAHEVLPGEVEQVRTFPLGLSAPFIECRTVAYPLRHEDIIKLENPLLVYQHIGPPGLVFQSGDVRNELAVMKKKRRLGDIFTGYQRRV
jgi:hypothetical protein